MNGLTMAKIISKEKRYGISQTNTTGNGTDHYYNNTLLTVFTFLFVYILNCT